MARVSVSEAMTKFPQLLKRAEAGEDVLIVRDGEAVARLVAITDHNSLAAVHGALRGQVHLADDFDELPDDVGEAFGAR
jgi:prevent-host-death family protein